MDNLKLLLKKLNFLTGLRPFVWVGIFFGIFQCNYAKNRFKHGNWIIRCHAFVLFVARLYFRISSFSTIIFPQPLLTKIMIVGTYASVLAVEIVNFVITAFFDRRFVSFFDKLATYDDHVSKLGHSRRDKTRSYWICLSLSITAAVSVMERFSRNPSVSWLNILKEDLRFSTQEFTYLLAILKFNLFVHLMYQRFRHLNDTILPNVSWTREFTRTKSLNFVTLSDVVVLHSTLADASAIVTGVYSVQLLLWFSNFIFTAVLYTYYVTYVTWHTAIPYCGVLIAEVLVTCIVCNSTAEEANNTGKRMSEDKPTLIEDSTAMERVRMQLYLMNNRVVFSAADFFEIKLSLLYSMFVSIATYGVLLTSYRKKQSSKP